LQVEGFAKVAEAILDVDLREQSTSTKKPALIVAGRESTRAANADE
jgi:hypothetical protein